MKEENSFQYLSGKKMATQRESSGKKRYEYVNDYSPVNKLEKSKTHINSISFSGNNKQYKYTE